MAIRLGNPDFRTNPHIRKNMNMMVSVTLYLNWTLCTGRETQYFSRLDGRRPQFVPKFISPQTHFLIIFTNTVQYFFPIRSLLVLST